MRDFGGYSRDPFNVGQVEVIKGPGSSVAGRGSTGGSINMVSKSPELDPSYKGSFAGGTDSYGRVTLDINQPIEQIEGAAFRLNTMYHTEDVPGRDSVYNERWGVAPAVTFGLEGPTQLTLRYFYMEQDLPDYGIPWVPNTNVPLAAFADKPAPVDWDNFYGLDNRDYEDIRADIVSAEVKHQINEDLSLRNLLQYGRLDRDSIVTAPRFNSNNSTDIRRTDWKDREQVDNIITNLTDFTYGFDTGEVKHTVVTGFEASLEKEKRYLKDDRGTASQTTDLYSPDPTDPYTDNIQRDGRDVRSEAFSLGLYAFDTLELNEHWELNGGVRWDRYDLNYDNAGSLLGRTDDMFSWRGGIVFKPQENGSIYAGYGTSFNPAGEGLALSSAATNAANVNADPEESRTVEVGTKWEFFEGGLALNSALFRTDKTNARTQDPDDANDTIVLEGEQYVQGIELGATGNVTDDWQVFAGYTYMDSRIEKSKDDGQVGNELSNTPRNSFNVWSTYQLPLNFEVGGGVQYVGERFNSFANTRTAPDYWRGDAMVAYQVSDSMTMRLNVLNIADVDYIDSVGGGHFIPGNGRSVILSTDFEF